MGTELSVEVDDRRVMPLRPACSLASPAPDSTIRKGMACTESLGWWRWARGLMKAPKIHERRARAATWRTPLLVLALVLNSACAGINSERHLAPLVTTLSLAEGHRETEALGGILLNRRNANTGKIDYWAMRPIFSSRQVSDSEVVRWFLPPLGRFRDRPDSRVWQFLPIWRYQSERQADGTKTWSLLALPGLYWAKTPDDRIVRAFFPIAGVVERFLSFDRAVFYLWPLFTRIEQHGRTSVHFLWPFFKWSWGEGGRTWRFWPLIGNKHWDDRYDRWFFLWPIFIWQLNGQHLATRPEESSWGIVPLFLKRRQGEAKQYSVLWPFFGYGEDPATGAWAWDGPWPFVRILNPGDTNGPRRERFWPFYSRYEGDGLTSRYLFFPFLNWRKEVYPDGGRSSFYAVPFWQSWERHYTDSDKHRSFRKLWPIWREGYEEEQGTYFAWPALNPLWRTPIIDEHYAWLWEVYASVRRPGVKRERSWLALWRREKDQDEDRRSLVGLWARRSYSQAGRAVRETSLLFGLLRFRTREGAGLEWMRPAIPGPGWPLDRVPNSIHPRTEGSN